MLIRNMMRKYYEEAGAEGAASGGAGGEAEKTFTAAEVDALIAKAVEAAVPEAIKGLKQKNDELISERRKDQERIAREKARADGKLEEFEATIRAQEREQYEPVVKSLEALKSRTIMAEKKAVLGGFTGDFIAPESVDLVAQLVKTELDGDQVKTQFTDFAGNVITTDPAEFKKWMAKHPAISHLMKADAASGGGAAGGKGSGSGAAPKFSALKDLPVR
jgi:hypothetical protein